ncbi:MAG: tetratricopeptide repeat protein [Bacteroidia bacterium]|nr:tetratricopeptide repeat protein [Bacteroidia bacterium]
MKKPNLKQVITIILTLLNLVAFAQNQEKASPEHSRRIDSLITILKTARHDTNRVKTYCLLSTFYLTSKLDTALYYANQGLALAQKNNWKKGISDSYYKIGTIYLKQGNHDKALFNYLKALKNSEEIGDISGICRCYNNIGLLHRASKEYDKALYYFEKSLKLSEDKKDKMTNAISNMNIGTIYQSQAKYEEAIKYYLKALKIYEESGVKSAIARCNGNIAITYIAQKKYDDAKKYLNKSLLFFEKAVDKDGIINVLNNLTLICIHQKDYNEAINHALKGLSVAKEINALPLEKDIYEKLTIVYDRLKDYKKAFEYQKLYKQLNDSIFNKESSRQFKEMEAKYHTEKKQKEIELLEKDKRIQTYEIRRQTFQKYVFIGGFGLMLILAVVIYFSYRQKRKANKLLAEQKNEIEQKNEELHTQNEEIQTQKDEIEAQRDEIITQRDIVTKQKQQIEYIHEELTDSIKYALRIQTAVLPGETHLRDKIKNEFFILFKPKDIVSGDFYYVERRKHWLLIAVADCTGHGVPGAFMSMLGISFLNEIIAKEEVQTASHVLDELRKYVIHSLQQKGIFGEQKDGMDIAFISLNTITNELQFAGANNPLYIVSSLMFDVSSSENNLKLQTSNLKLHEVKPDKMPVAIHDNMQPFTNHVIKLQKGDTFYLMSDGFADQIGGPKGKKYLSGNFKQLIFENSQKPIPEQKEILNKTIEDWRGKYEQTDDITVMGIRIS